MRRGGGSRAGCCGQVGAARMMPLPARMRCGGFAAVGDTKNEISNQGIDPAWSGPCSLIGLCVCAPSPRRIIRGGMHALWGWQALVLCVFAEPMAERSSGWNASRNHPLPYRSTSLTSNSSPWDPTVSLCLVSGGWVFSSEVPLQVHLSLKWRVGSFVIP